MPIKFSDGEPKTLAAAVEYLRAGLSADELDYIRANPSSSVHHTVGQQLRNAWLWCGVDLPNHFRDVYGLGHADDMSGMILANLWAVCRGETYDADADADHYRRFWADQHIDPLTQGWLKTVTDDRRAWRFRFIDAIRNLLHLEPLDDADAEIG
jgi:hypothetical protein